MAARAQMPKDKLVETAANLIYRQGWNATGINQILGDAEVPKGSFYYYFHSKEELGVAIVKYHAQKLDESYRRTLLNEQLSGREAIERFLGEQIELQRLGGWMLGCPVGSFSSEVAATPEEKIAIACRETLLAWVAALECAIERGQKDLSLKQGEAPSKLGVLALGVWQGALMLMKALRNEEPLLVAAQHVRELLYSGSAA